MIPNQPSGNDFESWMKNRLSPISVKNYMYWRQRMFRELGPAVTAEAMIAFYDRYPKPIVKGMLYNLGQWAKVTVTLPRVKGGRKSYLPKYYTEEEEEKIMQKMPTRYKSLLWLLSECGLRIGEACNLRYPDLRPKEGRIIITGKGNKQRIVYPSPALMDALFGQFSDLENPGMYLWPSPINPGEAIRPDSIRYYVRRIQKGAKPHTFRHTFATRVYGNTKNLRATQRALGHSSIQTTSIYTHIVDPEVEEAARTAWRKNG